MNPYAIRALLNRCTLLVGVSACASPPASTGSGVTPAECAALRALPARADSLTKAGVDPATVSAMMNEHAKAMKAPRPLPGNPAPSAAGVTASRARVVLTGMVDTTGRVVASSIRIKESSDAEFAASAQRAFAGYRYRPAEIVPGCTVAATVVLPFEFVQP